MKIYGVTGGKNTGKTGLIERLVKEFVIRGVTVSTIKHAHHDTDIDQPGRDSHRHREAGAHQVVLSSKHRWAVMTELRDAPEADLKSIIRSLEPVQLTLIEGYKNDPHPKIETFRLVISKPLLALTNSSIKGVASDSPISGLEIPIFDLNDTGKIADFISEEVRL
jgi:molybdopterin-guanine dinucleotide biosynthesis protein B|tara:strand:+ start:680 stop:1174 length:495 start_codon:yes stop_codon:yes gene_type:complete